MRIRITRSGIFRTPNEKIPVGTELEVPDDFTGWANKWVRVDSPKATLEVASPKRSPEEQEWLDAPAVGREVGSEQDDLEEARAEYEAAFGEKPHARMKAKTILARIAEAD